MSTVSMNIIAHIHTDFPTKFGIPRQSGLVDELTASIVFCPEYRNKDALRGLEDFSHLWLLWHFSETVRSEWQPTVRPPRLGGNTRMGVFATRSPFRPNPIGLSSVILDHIEWDTPEGPVLIVRGADLMDGTPLFDIKPYLSYADSHPEANNGFVSPQKEGTLQVSFPRELLCKVPMDKQIGLLAILSQDPRPRYQNDPERVYKMSFMNFDIHFTVSQEVLTVINLLPR